MQSAETRVESSMLVVAAAAEALAVMLHFDAMEHQSLAHW